MKTSNKTTMGQVATFLDVWILKCKEISVIDTNNLGYLSWIASLSVFPKCVLLSICFTEKLIIFCDPKKQRLDAQIHRRNPGYSPNATGHSKLFAIINLQKEYKICRYPSLIYPHNFSLMPFQNQRYIENTQENVRLLNPHLWSES